MTTLRSRRVVMGGEVRPATLRIEDGAIVEIGDATAEVDFGDLVVLPGLVDSHVHVNEPGRTEWEGFATATRAAAAGGTTTIVDMPLNSIPPTVDPPALAAKLAATRGKLSVDVAFWGGLVPGADPAGLVAEGVCGFKAFLVDSGVPEFPPVTPDQLVDVAPDLGGTPLLVHAEDPTLLREPRGDPRQYATYLATRPGVAEAAAIEAVATLTGTAPVHILHVAGGDATEAIRPHAALTAETCPHYLTFTDEDVADGATTFKCAPPIRTAEDREALWEALADGTIGMVVSDHSPAPPEVKDPAGGDFMAAWGGIASVGERLVATWDGARRRGHTVVDLARWLAAAPAALAGLDHRKGAVAVGHDADLVVFDPEGTTVVDVRRLRQRHPVSPYDGRRLAGRVLATYLGGIELDGTVCRGRPLRRGE